MVFTICMCIIYLVYRGLYTLNVDTPFAAVFSITLYLAEIYGNMLMFLYFFQIWEPQNPEPVPPLKDAKVDAYIPTYNEEPELLRGTIVAALEMDYPHETYVLDDGNRPEVRELTEELGAKYINRDSNIHAKAGNLNHAMEITDGEYIIVFDSDHIAERHFITRTLGYFADDDLAFIQTPHSYYNFDSFQGSLDYDKRFYWEEGQLFYNIVQPGRNYWNSASFCGSAAIFRKEALESVGLIATESITEDMQTGLRLHSQGWKSLYINERLVSGLAAPDIETFSVQRLRWGEGNLGTIFFDNPITAKGLSFPQRLNYLALMLSWTTGVQKLILYYTPLLMLLTGVGPVADMTWTLVGITIFYVLTVWYTVKASGNGYGRLLDTEITQMATFWTQCRGTWRALFNRKKASFVVTQKSGGGKDSSIHDFLRPQYTFIGCSVVAVTWAASRYFLGVSEDFLGLSICSVLVFFHCIFAWIVIRRALAQRRFDWRHPCSAHIRYELESDEGIQIGEGVTKDLSETGVGFLTYEKLNGHKLKVTITAGDTSVTASGRICNWEYLVDYKSRKEGEVRCFRYGVEFEELGEEQLRNLWHICTKYAVARRYVEFDPNREDGLLDPVRGAKDHPLTVAARLYSPDVGDVYSVTETMTNTTFTMLSNEKLKQGTLLRGQLSAPTGQLTGNVRVEQAKEIELGQMPLHAYRCKFDGFDGQSRGKLTTLLHLSHDKKMSAVTTLRPKKTKMPIAQPLTIIAGITALAAALTLVATFFLCGDQVLMARVILGKPIDESGNARLSHLVSQFERAPTTNERLFLRLRESMLAANDAESISRLNEALISNEFKSPAAKLQQAYALEELGRTEEARVAFANLIMEIDEFRSGKTRASVVLAAARNAANRKSFDESQKLYQRVWESGVINSEIRAEYAGVLATNKKFDQAIDVLTSDDLTIDDRYLLASLLAGCQRFEAAKRIYDKLVQIDPDDIRAQKGVADLAAWTKNYPSAIEKYQAILRNRKWRDDASTKVALAKALAWSGDHKKAVEYGKELLEELEPADRRQVWQPVLDSLAELKQDEPDDQALIMQAYGERNEHEANPFFMEKLAECLMFAFDAEQAEPLVEQLVTICPNSHLLQIRYAQTLFTIGEYDQAAKYYGQLIDTDALPTDLMERGNVLLAAAYNSAQRGATSESAEQYEMARDCYVQFVEDNPLDVKYWGPFLDAVSGAKSRDNDVALSVFEIYNARTSVEMDRKTRLRLADALATINEERHAIRLLDEVDSGTEDVEVNWRRANLLLRMGKHDEAARYYDRLLQEQAFTGDVSQQVELLLASASNCAARGLTTLSHERYSQILRILRPKLEKQPNQSGLWLPFLSAFSGMGGGSPEDLKIVMSIYENRAHLLQNTEFVERLKDVLLVSKEHAAVLPLFELLMEKQTSRRLRLQYAQALHTVGRNGTAENLFDKLLLSKRKGEPATQPNDVARHEILISAAHNKGALGEHVEAQALYGQTLAELEPILRRDINQTDYWSAFLLAMSGRADILPQHAKIANKIYRNRDLLEDDPEFVTNLGHVMSLMEEYRSAVDLLKRGVLRFGNDRRLRTELARAHSKLGEYRDADSHYRWLLDHWEPPTLLAETQLLTEAALNGRHIGADERYDEYASRALSILTQALTTNPDASQLWQPFLDAANGELELSESSQEITDSLFKRWRERAEDERFLSGLANLLVKSNDARRAIILLEQLGDTKPDSLFRLAMLHKDIGEYRQADAQFQQLIEDNAFGSDPGQSADLLLAAADNARLWNKTKLQEARFGEALRYLRKAKSGVGDRSMAIRYLDALRGAAEVAAEDVAAALEIHRRWSDDTDPEIRIRLVDVLLKVNHPNEALPILQSLVRDFPDAAENQMRLANVLQALEQYEEAGIILDGLLREAVPGESSKLVNLYAAAARNSLSRHQFAKARQRFEKLFSLVVDREPFEFEYAISLEKTGKPTEALRILEGKRDLDPEQELLLASMYLSTEEFVKAQEAYERVLQVQPDNLKAQRGVADIAFWMEDYANAIKRYESLEGQNSNDPEFRESLASARLWKGEYQEALTEFTAMVKADPSRQALWPRFLEAAAGAQELTAQQRQMVSRIAGQVTTLTGGFAEKIEKPLLDVYTTHRDYEKALTLSKKLRDASPNDPSLLAKHASLLGKLGKTQESLEIWQQLVNSNPNSEAYRAQLANAYAVVGDDENANEHYTTLFAQTFQATSVEHGRRLLGAASVSQRLNRTAEAITRYDRAIDILLPLVEEGTGTELWQPLLDAVASVSAKKLTPRVRETVGDIYENRQKHVDTKDFKVRLADVLLRLDAAFRALPILKNLAASYPQDREIEMRLAGALLRSQDFATAIPMLERLAISDSENSSKWRGQLASALHATEEYSKAETIYETLLTETEGSEEGRSKLLIQAARNSVGLKQFEKAKARLGRIPELMLADETLRAQYSGLLLRMGDHEKVNSLLADQNRSTETLEIVAGAYESINDMSTAERLYREILTKLPGDIAATHGLARIAMAEEDFQTAEELLNECADRDPTDRRILFDLGYAYLGLDDYELAADTFLELRHSSVNQRKVTAAYLQAVAGIESPDSTHVERALEIYHDVVGNADEALSIPLADVLLRAEKYSEVLQLVKPLLPSENGEVALRFAHASLNVGNAADAVGIYEANLSGNPDDSQNKFLLAAALQKSGQNVRAAKLFNELLQQENVRGKWFMLASDNADTMGDKAKGVEYAGAAAEFMLKQIEADELPQSEYVHLVRAITRAGIDSPEANEAIDMIYGLTDENSSGLLLAELANAFIDRKEMSPVQSIMQTLAANEYGQLVTEKYGDLLVEVRRYPEAIELFRGLAAESNDSSYDYRLGLLYAKVGEFADAIGYLSRVREQGKITTKDARYDVFTLALAETERRLAHREIADSHFESVAARYRSVVTKSEADIDDWRKYLFAIRGLSKIKEPDKKLVRSAMKQLELFDEDQEIVEALCDFAVVFDEDNPSAAIEFVDQVLQLFPDSIGARFAKSRAWFLAENFEEADELLTQLQRELNDPVAAESDNDHVWKWTTPVGRVDILDLHAQVHLSAKDFKSALVLYESAPELAEIAPVQYGWVLMETGNVQRAIDWMKSQELEHPKQVAFLAALYLENDEDELAASTIESLFEKYDNDFEVQRVVANVLFRTRQYEEAIVLYEALKDRFPEDDEIRESLGKARLWIGDYEEADEILTDLVAKGERSDIWVITLDAMAGSELSSLEDEALLKILKGYKKQEYKRQVRLAERLSSVHRHCDEPKLALEILRPYTEADDVRFKMEYGDVLSELSRHKEAISVYRWCVKQLQEEKETIEETELRLRFGDVLYQAKHLDEAQPEFDFVLANTDEKEPGRLRHVLVSSAKNLIALERVDEALELFTRIYDEDPEEFDLYEEFASVLLAAERPQESLNWLLRDNELTLGGEYLLGAIYAKLSRFDQARSVYMSIVKRYPDDLKAWRLLAEVSTWAQDYETAIHIYLQLLERDPDSEPLRIGLANAYLWSGRHQLAIQIYTKELTKNANRYDLWESFVHAATRKDVTLSNESYRLLVQIVHAQNRWPKNYAFRLTMVDGLFKVGNEKPAMMLLYSLLVERPHDRKLRRRYADELHRLGHYRQADRIYAELLKSRPVEQSQKKNDVRTQVIGDAKSEPRWKLPRREQPVRVAE